MIKKILKIAARRKIVTGMIILLAIIGAYAGYKAIKGSSAETRHVLAAVRKGTLIVSISGSGQVSTSNQVDVKSKVTGDIIYVGVKAGQYAPAGTLIAQLYAREAQKAVRDAEINLESAQLDYDQITGAISGIRGAKEKDLESLAKAYDDGFNAVTSAFADLPEAITGLQSIFFVSEISSGGIWNFDYYVGGIWKYDEAAAEQMRDDFNVKWNEAKKAYDKNFIDYKSVSRFSEEAKIEATIDQTYKTGRLVSDAVKSAIDLVKEYKNQLTEAGRRPEPIADTHISTLNNYASKINGLIQSLYSAQSGILNGKESIIGVDFNIRSSKIQLDKAKDALLNAQEKLAEYYVRAPFSGVIAKLNVKVGDSSVSNVATLITKQKIAEVSLNEIDVAQVKVGQKATLTFDAVPDLTITGQVAEVDAVGTVSQGVVTYTVKIAFDTQDDRVKTAMSVSAAIVTEAKPNVILVPNSAVKSQGGTSYVEIADGDDRDLALAANASGAILKNPPRRQQVETGTASDEFTEIVSGLREGDVIVTRTIQPTSAQTTQTQQKSSVGIPGLNTGVGGMRR